MGLFMGSLFFWKHFLKNLFLFVILERRREGERVGEEHQPGPAFHTLPDWESNGQPLRLWDDTQLNEPHWLGLLLLILLQYHAILIHMSLWCSFIGAQCHTSNFILSQYCWGYPGFFVVPYKIFYYYSSAKYAVSILTGIVFSL